MISMYLRFITGLDENQTTYGHYAGPSACLGVDRAGGITLHFGAWRRSSPPDSNSKPEGLLPGDTLLCWELASRLSRIPVAYQTDRKPFPFRSGFWLPGDYGSTP